MRSWPTGRRRARRSFRLASARTGLDGGMARSHRSRRKAVYRGLELGQRLHVERSLEDLTFNTCTIFDAQSPGAYSARHLAVDRQFGSLHRPFDRSLPPDDQAFATALALDIPGDLQWALCCHHTLDPDTSGDHGRWLDPIPPRRGGHGGIDWAADRCRNTGRSGKRSWVPDWGHASHHSGIDWLRDPEF